MVQTIIALVIVGAAVGFAVRRLMRTLRNKKGCSCGCSNCPMKKGECHCHSEIGLPDIHLD